MKRMIKCTLMCIVASSMLVGCSLWEETWTECRSLSETETPVTIDPWEPPETDNKTVGE